MIDFICTFGIEKYSAQLTSPLLKIVIAVADLSKLVELLSPDTKASGAKNIVLFKSKLSCLIRVFSVNALPAISLIFKGKISLTPD